MLQVCLPERWSIVTIASWRSSIPNTQKRCNGSVVMRGSESLQTLNRVRDSHAIGRGLNARRRVSEGDWPKDRLYSRAKRPRL